MEKEKTKGFKPTGRYDFNKREKESGLYNDTIPSASYQSDYKALLKYNTFKKKNQLIINNGATEKAVIVDGIDEIVGFIVLDRLKENKEVADIVYNTKKGLKNVRPKDILESIKEAYNSVEDNYSDIPLHPPIPDNPNNENPDLEEAVELNFEQEKDESFTKIVEMTKSYKKD